MTYTYDLADRLLTMTYPSGRIVTYVRDAQGKITGVTTKANATAAVVTLASNVKWQPMGGGQTVFGAGQSGHRDADTGAAGRCGSGRTSISCSR